MRFVIGVQYDVEPNNEDPDAKRHAIALTLAHELLEFDGVTAVEVHGDTAEILSPPGAAILAGGDWTYPRNTETDSVT